MSKKVVLQIVIYFVAQLLKTLDNANEFKISLQAKLSNRAVTFSFPFVSSKSSCIYIKQCNNNVAYKCICRIHEVDELMLLICNL